MTVNGWPPVPPDTGGETSDPLRGEGSIVDPDTNVVVAHGLPRKPEPGEVQIQPRNVGHAVERYALRLEDASEFTVEVDPAPGTGNSFEFGWLWTPAEPAPIPPKPLIEELGSLSTLSSSPLTLGWRFTVGATALTAIALRIYFPQTATREVRLWRDDGTLLASVDVGAVANEWAQAAIDPVTLDANEDYAVTVHNPSGSSYNGGTPSEFTFNDAITFVSSRWLSTSNPDAFPTNTSPNVYGIVDVVV